jgi:hypothetical protein
LGRRERKLSPALLFWGELVGVASGGYVCVVIEPLNAIEEAERAGFDMSLIDANLSYSYEKRVLLHDAALELALEFERIGRQLRGYRVDEQWVVTKLWELREKQAKA